MTSRIRVFLVDDSATYRMWLKNLLMSDPELEIVGEAVDGSEAIQKLRTITADVIIMDLVMPKLDGVAATKQIMKTMPAPIVLLSGGESGQLDKQASEAIAAGALILVKKPIAGEKEKWEANFLRTVRAASRVPVKWRKVITPASSVEHGPVGLVAIGASTGGSEAIWQILRGLPVLKVPVLIVVHSSNELSDVLLSWYNSISMMPVVIAQKGAALSTLNGKVVMAPPDRHLVLKGNTLDLTLDQPRLFCRPSVDVLFESIAVEGKRRAICIILSGMGSDGAEGLLAVRRAGGLTIAQDEKTSTVFGMPKAAIERGAAQFILPHTEIARAIINLTSNKEP